MTKNDDSLVYLPFNLNLSSRANKFDFSSIKKLFEESTTKVGKL